MSCSSCKPHRCATTQACHQPEEAAPRRETARDLPRYWGRVTFKPTYDLRGPYRRLTRPRPLLKLVGLFAALAIVLAIVFLFLYR